jgi:hypothetical protein
MVLTKIFLVTLFLYSLVAQRIARAALAVSILFTAAGKRRMKDGVRAV